MNDFSGPWTHYRGLYRDRPTVLAFHIVIRNERVIEEYTLDGSAISKDQALEVYREIREMQIDMGNYG